MESRLFITTAAALVRRIKDFALVTVIDGDDQGEAEAIQKQINLAFSGLQNPTLPSAAKLRDTALEHYFDVDPRVLHRLQQAESCWG